MKNQIYLIRDSEILNCIPTNVAFWHSPKPISILHFNSHCDHESQKMIILSHYKNKLKKNKT